ncbi:hypothetical protein G6L26_009615 [Agrobacterium radiobacter]|uniref:hypothetical protein n=1 Tax=Agrobacterium tumefaciens complex TaxID=1183400 RepID=UPI00080FDEF4|nr:hypothetical protein [Agrobacterium tumefaciens]NTA05442.1 hypothetical protein [Agrobacterium tumefaciens]NTA92035.1 hypothetical protein [Agrobacterium tumefaciens]OCJ32194.1 hypothetical protein A6U90_09765 [Agrobacterium tumefaciens]
MSDKDRQIRRKNAIYRKGLHEGYRLGLAAAEREAQLCHMAWDGTARVAASALADQIGKLGVSEDDIQRMVVSRHDD